MRRTKDPCQDHHWPDVLFPTLGASPTSLLLRGSFSDKSPSRTTSLRLAQQAARSHEQSPSTTKAQSTQCGATPTHGLFRYDTWGTSSPCHANTPAGGTRGQTALTRGVMQCCSATPPSTQRHIRPCSTPTPTEALEFPLQLALAYG
jgi:hypothetical protein